MPLMMKIKKLLPLTAFQWHAEWDVDLISRLPNLSEAIKTRLSLCGWSGFWAGCIIVICAGDMFRINQLTEMLNLFYGKLIHFHLIYGSSNHQDTIGPWLLIISSLYYQFRTWRDKKNLSFAPQMLEKVLCRDWQCSVVFINV